MTQQYPKPIAIYKPNARQSRLRLTTSLPGGHSVLEPPDPIPNSEVKRLSADDSVGFPMRK